MGRNEYINGFLERKAGGKYEGEIIIEGINLSPIMGVMFNEQGKDYLWLRRKDMMVYDEEQQVYISRKRKPQWEAYLEKQIEDDAIAYKGIFPFARCKFSIVGVWDDVLGMEKNRMNFFVSRLSMDKQDIIHGIREMRKKI